MSPAAWAELGLTVFALGAFTWLAAERYRVVDHQRISISPNSRLLLADLLLVIAGVEMVADTVSQSLGRETTGGDIMNVISLVGRGALIAGAFALLMTFPAQNP